MMKINFNRIILTVVSISIITGLTVTVLTKEAFPLMAVALVLLFLSPSGLFSMTFYNNHLKKIDSRRFLPVDNSDNLRAVIVYLAGFFVIIFTPVIIVLVLTLISEFMRFHSNSENLIALFLYIAIGMSTVYIIMLENRKKLDDIQAINTLKISFLFMQLFTAGIIIFIALLVHSIFFHTDDTFEKLKYLAVLALAGTFSMPYMLFFNVLSHISRPKSNPYNE